MNFIGEIGNLTLPQIQEYLSGKRPFPGGQMALAAHMPALAAQAVRMRMKDGGEVPKIDKRMQALLAQRFARGGEVYSLDAQGRMIGKRKATDPALNGEVSFEPVPEDGGKSFLSKNMAVYNAQGERIGKRRASEPLLQGEQTAEPMPLGIALPDASGVIDRNLEGLRGMVGAVSPIKGVSWLGSKIAENYRRQQALRDGAKSGVDSTKILNALGLGDEPAALGMSKADPAWLQSLTANGTEPLGATTGNTLGGSGIAMSAQSTGGFNTGPAPKEPDFTPYKKTLDAYEKELGTPNDAKNLERLKGIMGIKDRSEARLKDIEALKTGFEQDRELGKWMALAQFAAGMQGKRNLAAGLAGGIERGVPAFAAAQAAYRKGMSEAADKQMRIEDAADLMNRELGSKTIDMTDKQKAELRGIAKERLGLTSAEFEAAFKIWKEKNDVAKDKAYIAAYGTRATGSGGYTYKDAVDDARLTLDQMAKTNPIEYRRRLKEANNDQALLQDMYVKELLSRKGGSGTMPTAAPSAIRNPELWSVTPGK